MKLRVSAIIPVYNGERFIADAIRSVLGQTWPVYECIVVDDGSTDGTARVVEEFGDAVRLIRQLNTGVSGARNAGVAAARGELVAFLDSDDVWLREKLERQLPFFQQRPELGMVYSGIVFVDEALNPTRSMYAPAGEDALRNTLLMEAPFVPFSMTAVVPVRVFQEVGGFDERLKIGEDLDLICRIASAYPVDGVQAPLTLYRIHSEGQMHRDPAQVERDMRAIYAKLFGGGLPPEMARQRARAYTNLHAMLALSYLRRRETAAFCRHLAAAVLSDPARAFTLLSKLAAKRLARPRSEERK